MYWRKLMVINPITQDELHYLLHYDQETGAFTWKVRRRGVWSNGSMRAGTVEVHGYVRILIDRQSYRAHRLAFLWMTGRWPKAIDHIDGNRSNNCWANLREATTRQNAHNKKPLRQGHKGVCLDKRDGRWDAYIRDGEKRRYLGRFPTEEAAALAYNAAAAASFGEFARLNVIGAS